MGRLQLFELLHQDSQASQLGANVQDLDRRCVSSDEFAQLQRFASESLQASPKGPPALAS